MWTDVDTEFIGLECSVEQLYFTTLILHVSHIFQNGRYSYSGMKNTKLYAH